MTSRKHKRVCCGRRWFEQVCGSLQSTYRLSAVWLVSLLNGHRSLTGETFLMSSISSIMVSSSLRSSNGTLNRESEIALQRNEGHPESVRLTDVSNRSMEREQGKISRPTKTHSGSQQRRQTFIEVSNYAM
jgi:hypothetical protein